MKSPNYKAYYENETLWIIDVNNHNGYKATQEKILSFHTTIDLQALTKQNPIPSFFWDIVHELDGLCKI